MTFSFAAFLTVLAASWAGAVVVKSDHPRVLIAKEDLPGLVERCETEGIMSDRYKIILDHCQELLEGKAKLDPGAIWGPARDWCYLALAALVEHSAGRDGRKYAKFFTNQIWDRFTEEGELPAGHYGYHALVFDWMYPVLTPEERKTYSDLVASTLTKGWSDNLSDKTNWWYNQEWGPHHLSDTHNRTAVVCKTLTALAIVGEGTRYEEKAKRIINAFEKHIPGSCLPALNEMGGAWGEGLGHFYYMNPVQFYVFEAWRTATGQNLWEEFEPTGYAREVSKWILYSTQPFNMRHPYIDDSGGSFPRLLAAPLLARVYRDGAAQWIYKTFDEKGRKGAGRGYGFWEAWQGLLWHDPSVPVVRVEEMPTAYLLKGAGHVYMRSGWSGPNETWAFFGAGPRYAGWASDDEGHFLIAKQGPLVTRGSGKADTNGYTAGTAIFNCVLVYDPNEYPGRDVEHNENDGGLLRAGALQLTGDPWKNRGSLVAYQHRPQVFTYTAADLTDGYANVNHPEHVFKKAKSRKIRSITRQFLYLRGESEHFVVFDRVDASNKDFPKTWMLHMGNEPSVLTAGSPAKAIETGAGFATYKSNACTAFWLSAPEGETDVVSTGKAKIFCKTLLPKRAKITKRGGKGYDTWGNPHNPKARRQHLSVRQSEESPPYRLWRLEVEPIEKSQYDVFLHVLSLTSEDETNPPEITLLEKDGKCGVTIISGDRKTEVLFNKSGEVSGDVWVKDGARQAQHWRLPNKIVQAIEEGEE